MSGRKAGSGSSTPEATHGLASCSDEQEVICCFIETRRALDSRCPCPGSVPPHSPLSSLDTQLDFWGIVRPLSTPNNTLKSPIGAAARLSFQLGRPLPVGA